MATHVVVLRHGEGTAKAEYEIAVSVTYPPPHRDASGALVAGSSRRNASGVEITIASTWRGDVFSRMLKLGELDASVRLASSPRRTKPPPSHPSVQPSRRGRAHDSIAADTTGIFIVGSPPAALRSPVAFAELLGEALEIEVAGLEEAAAAGSGSSPTASEKVKVKKRTTFGVMVTGGGEQDTPGPRVSISCNSQEVDDLDGGAFMIQM